MLSKISNCSWTLQSTPKCLHEVCFLNLTLWSWTMQCSDKWRGKSYHQKHFAPKIQFGGVSIMVWVEICFEANRDLEESLWMHNLDPHVRFHLSFGRLFNYCSACCHTAMVIKNYLWEVGIETVKWSARSLDINPIENL